MHVKKTNGTPGKFFKSIPTVPRTKYFRLQIRFKIFKSRVIVL